MKILIYEDTARYDFWLKILLGGIIGLTLVLGIASLLWHDVDAALAMFGITLFDALLFKAILPQRFQIFEDGVRIDLGGPLSINIPFSSIERIKSASGRKASVYWGIRFATSSMGVVEIIRKKGLNLVISPSHDELFLEQANAALELSLFKLGNNIT